MKKGYKFSEEVKKKMSESALKRNNTNRIRSLPKGKDHWNWSEKPSLLTLHKRIHRLLGKAKNYMCVTCDKKAHDWANFGDYTDVKKYKPLCRSCHVKMDKNWIKKK